MWFGSESGRKGAGNCLLAAVAVGVTLAVALVAPANGLSDPDAHQFALVHPIFLHDHDRGAARVGDRPTAPVDTEPRAAVGPGATGTGSALVPAEPFGPGLGLSIGGMLGVAPLGFLGLVLMPSLAMDGPRLRQQASADVPTGPPR